MKARNTIRCLVSRDHHNVDLVEFDHLKVLQSVVLFFYIDDTMLIEFGDQEVKGIVDTLLRSMHARV